MIGLTNKPLISVIAAINHERVIGVDGAIPWHVPKDLQFYKQVTTGNVVIVGRKTFESLPPQALRNRHYVVVTRQQNPISVKLGMKVSVVNDFNAAVIKAIELCYEGKGRNVVIAGGGTIYGEAEKCGLVDEVFLTRVSTPDARLDLKALEQSGSEITTVVMSTASPCNCEYHEESYIDGDDSEVVWTHYVNYQIKTRSVRAHMICRMKAFLANAGIKLKRVN